MQIFFPRLHCEFRIESLNTDMLSAAELGSISSAHQEMETSEADSAPMLNASQSQ
jgi:hypothetical protein